MSVKEVVYLIESQDLMFRSSKTFALDSTILELRRFDQTCRSRRAERGFKNASEQRIEDALSNGSRGKDIKRQTRSTTNKCASMHGG